MSKKQQRDHGRTRLYAAEENSHLYRWAGDSFLTTKECQDYVDRVLRSKWFKKRARKIKNIFVRKRGISWSYAETRVPFEELTLEQKTIDWQGAITLTRFSMDKCTILHELAHHAVGLEEGHNEKFCKTLLDMTRRFLGREAADVLEKNYKKHKVQYTD